MGRQRIPEGTYGTVHVMQTGDKNFRARARFRDKDGVARYVAGFGSTPDNARIAFLEKVAQRKPPGSGKTTARTTVETLAKQWLRQVDEATAKRSQTTRARYRTLVEGIVIPGMGQLLIGEASTELVDAFLKSVTAKHGAATARTVRTCLTQMFRFATVRGAVMTNPVREAEPIDSEPGKQARALTRAEEHSLVARLRKDRLSNEHDLVDLVVFMLATGVRVGEACALREPQVDLAKGTVTIAATVTPYGIQERTKTRAGHRVLALPPHAVTMLRRRLDDPLIRTDVAMFPSPLGHVRDKSNTTAHLRRAFDRAGFTWLTSHGLRKTVATRLDEAGLSARAVADQLGHSRPSLTQDVYMGRRVVTREAASILLPP